MEAVRSHDPGRRRTVIGITVPVVVLNSDRFRLRPAASMVGAFLAGAMVGLAGPARAQVPSPDRIAPAARGIMERARYAAFITVDSAGGPQARTVDPLLSDTGFVVWIGTNPRTRKVAEIRRNPSVALYWFDQSVGGYVTIRGRALLVQDPDEKARQWKPEWRPFYPDRSRDFVLLKVVPLRLEVVSPRDGVSGDSLTWRPPTVRWP